ncbi:MAG: type II secretion system F family protein [Loktanella sp.]|jgi:tight adherence protein B|nr:type II secretion system F family protein [bacterium]MDB9808600.1 type II secretion system F family protein [Yoonia sp.]MDO7556930.1 type II secretion system F family protein [Loktanella sp.]MDO7622599.1 type II secretion system F family protein [Loktanella sp.]MDO7626206.1 type II secretion system F family protein [Loktanella sp.]
MISAAPIIYIVIFAAVIAIVQGTYLVIFGKSISMNGKVNRRLELLEKGGGREQVLEQLRKEMTQHMKSQSIPLYSILATKAQKANIAFTPVQLIMLMGAVSVVAYVGLLIGTEVNPQVRIALSLGMGIGGVFVWINTKANKRMSMIEEQLPEAVELMVRSLRVGHPFTSAVAIVANEVADPLGTEMGVISDEVAYGRDVGECLKAMAERLDMQDMRFLAVAVTIQQTSGGNLAEILDGLAKVIRSRFRLFRRVQAITAEAKWSGKLLSGFPIVAMIGVNVVDPNYFDEVKLSPMFIPACLVVAGLLIANLFVMRALVNIKV